MRDEGSNKQRYDKRDGKRDEERGEEKKRRET